MRSAVLILVFAALQLSAQQASFSGVVIDAITKQPMAGVHVTVSWIAKFPDPSQPYGAISGPDGQFTIPSLPPGTYQLMAHRHGFLYLQDENKDATQALIKLKAGDAVTDGIVEMTPEAVISGRVVDDYGDPVQGAWVRASAVGADSSMSTVLQRMNASTDERGQFRMTGAPGRFRVGASTRQRGPGMNEVRTDGSEIPVYAETWYPSAETEKRGAVVEAVAGRETSGLDIRLVRKRTFTISGVVTGTPEGWVHAEVAIYSKYGQGPSITPDSDGRFTLSGLPADQYTLWALFQSGDLELRSAPVDLLLEAANETGLNLRLSPGEALSGTLEFEGQRVSQTTAIRLETRQRFSWDAIAKDEVNRDGKFTFSSVFPGKYRVRIDSLPENAFIKSVTADGAAVAGSVIDLSRGVNGSKIKVTIGLNGASIEGTVTSENGKPDCCAMVVLADSIEDVNDYMKSVRGGEKFRFTGLHPGKYRLIVSGPSKPYGTQTAEELFAQSPEIELHEGDRITRGVTFKPRGVQ